MQNPHELCASCLSLNVNREGKLKAQPTAVVSRQSNVLSDPGQAYMLKYKHQGHKTGPAS